MLYVDEKRCSGCGKCVEVCPTGAITISRSTAIIDQQRCSQCQACFDACPEQAILCVSEHSLVPQQESRSAVAVSGAPRPASIAARALPAVAAALIYVGREVVPRAASLVLDAVERKMAQSPRGDVEQMATGSGRTGRSGSGRRQRKRHRGA
jgi:dissimilatory sulfite reductase (desulfoviridin) alpha/beta subunit